MKVAYLPLYVRDWRSDPQVAFLEWAERALYLDMLMLSWELGPLPNDARKILRALGAPHAEDAVMSILRTFFSQSDHGWTNPRLESERARTEKLVAANSARGRRSGRVRRRKSLASDSHVTPTSLPRHSEDVRPEPEPEPEPFPSSSSPPPTNPPPLRSGGASAPKGPIGAGKTRTGPDPDSPTGGLPGIEITPPKGKREPTQNQIDGFVARGVWQRCWLERFGKPCTGLRDAKSASVRTAFVRLGRDEAELERLVRAFLAAPPYKHRENPDTIAFLESLDSVRAGLNGKSHGRPTARERQDADIRAGLDEVHKLFHGTEVHQ